MGKRIKNGFILFLCMAVLMTAMPVIRVDAADTMEEPVLDAGIYISSTTVSTGSYGYLSVQAENFADVSGMEFSIYYDASIMTNISCWSGWLVSGTTMDINTQTPGEIKCSFLSLDGIDGGGELLSFNFYVPETAATGNYSLRLAVGEVYDIGLTPIQMAKRSGNVSVMKGAPTVSSVYFYPNMYESEVKCGETFTYRLMAGTSYGLSGGNFEFEYDKDLLTIEDVSLGSALQTSTSLSAVNTENDGYVKITYADIDAISEEYGTEYFILTFRAKEDVSGHTQIRFSANGLTSVDLNKLMTPTLETQIYVKNPEQMPDTATLRFEVDKENSTRRNLKVNVILEGKAGVAAGDFTIQYSSWLMTCVAAEESEAITNADGAYLMTKETISDGYIYFSYVNTKPFTKSQTIMTLDFQIREWNSGTANLYISGRGVVDIDFKALPVEYETLSVYVDGNPIDVNNVNFWIEEGSYVYNGSNHYPKVLNDSGLVEGVDYWLGYDENYNAGCGYVWIYGMGEYTGSTSVCFEILKGNIENLDIRLSYTSTTYNGEYKYPEVLTDGLMPGWDFQTNYYDNLYAGTARVVIEGINNYEGQKILTFEILPSAQNSIEMYSFWLDQSSYVYDGMPKYPAVYNNHALTEGVDYEVSYVNNVDVGMSMVEIRGIGQYTGEVLLGFDILPADISSKKVVLSYYSAIYDGTEKRPVVQIGNLIEGYDYTVTYSNNIYMGTAMVTVNGIHNYQGQSSETFVIVDPSADMSKDIAAYEFKLDGYTFTYNGSEIYPGVMNSSGLIEGRDYRLYYSQNIQAGWGYVTAEGMGEYYGKVDMMFEIKPADLGARFMTLSQYSYTYDGMEKRPMVKIDGLMEGMDYTVSYWNNIEVGTATVEVRGMGNYEGTLMTTFEIQAAQPEGAKDIAKYVFELECSSYVYDGMEKRPIVYSKDGLLEGNDYIVTYHQNVNAGWPYVTIEGIGNYFGTLDLMFEIKPASIGAKEIALEYEITTYDGTEKCPAVFVKGLEMGKDFKVTYSNNVNVGTATVTIEGIGNYQGTCVFMFKIEEASTPGPDEPEKPEGLPFTDVSEGKWFYNSVKWAYENGLLTGTSETTFDPNGQMTRGMLVTVLYRKEGRPAVEETSKFPDVNPKKYYAPAIIWASANKLVSGYTNGNFGPEDSITREQMAKILYLYAAYEGYDTSNSTDISGYKDAAKVSGYAKKYMQWAVAEGLIKGSNGELNPKGNATRAEISAILKRFVEKYEVTAY